MLTASSIRTLNLFIIAAQIPGRLISTSLYMGLLLTPLVKLRLLLLSISCNVFPASQTQCAGENQLLPLWCWSHSALVSITADLYLCFLPEVHGDNSTMSTTRAWLSSQETNLKIIQFSHVWDLLEVLNFRVLYSEPSVISQPLHGFSILDIWLPQGFSVRLSTLISCHPLYVPIFHTGLWWPSSLLGFTWTWASELCPHACNASALPAESSPQTTLAF